MEGLRGHIQAGLLSLKRWAKGLDDRGSDAERYRSPREIALQNAADSLGVKFGEDYIASLDLQDIPLDLEGVDDPSRVDAFREEMLAYIQGRRRRRRRARALKSGMIVAAFVISAAVVGEIMRPDSRREIGDISDGRSKFKYPGADVGLSKLGGRVTTSMPAVDKGRLVHSAYADLQGNVCSSTAQVVRGITRNESGGGCQQPADIARVVARVPAFFTGVAGADGYVLVSGFARAGLERIVPDDARVRIESTITSAWHPGGNASPGFALKAFLVRIWHGLGVRFGSLDHLVANERSLGLTARFADSSSSRIAGPDEALRGNPPPRQIIDPIPEPIEFVDCVVLAPNERPEPHGPPRC